MDLDEFRVILGNSRVDIWRFIEAAIKVASLDYGDELRVHRDSIVAKLYANCPNCDSLSRVKASNCNGVVSNGAVEAVFGGEGEEEVNEERVHHHKEEEVNEERVHHHKEVEQRLVDDDGDGGDGGDDDDGFEYDEERKIVSIKEQLEDPNQTEDSLVGLLQILADMDITFKSLKETDIGRHVNRLRKHPSNDVRQLVKLLVRKWKGLVDEWVKSNAPAEPIAEGESPNQNFSKNQPNGHNNQVPDFGYSPNPHNGSSGSDKSECKPKVVPPRAPPPQQKEPPAKPMKTATPPSGGPPNRQKQVEADPDRLASARKRLQENYQEAQNAKKQRTIQVMDIHEIPKNKSKNSFFGRNKGGFQRR